MFLTACIVRLQLPDFSHLCHMRGQLISCLSQPKFEEIYNISVNYILCQLYLGILLISNNLHRRTSRYCPPLRLGKNPALRVSLASPIKVLKDTERLADSSEDVDCTGFGYGLEEPSANFIDLSASTSLISSGLP
jgi:hypothetical protein